MTAIELRRIANFRDFGGYAGAGGRRVQNGLLYRSGHHANATDDDLATVAALDLALVVELRRPAERRRDPARRPAGGRAVVIEHAGPLDMAQVNAPHLAFLAEPDISSDVIVQRMVSSYRAYPTDPHYRALHRDYFARLADLDGPVLIQCHAGKDRTGVLCGLTQHLLGVSREDIYADYLLTNRYSRADRRAAQMLQEFQETHGRPISEALVRQLMAADAAYLEAYFGELDGSHGGPDAYLEQVLGVTPAMREAIRARLLSRVD